MGSAVLSPSFSVAYWSDRALAYRSKNRLPQCLDAWQQVLALDPANGPARCYRALALLAMGRYQEGFPAWESRWEATNVRRPALTDRGVLGSEWDGSDPAGKRILLHGEQGLGDCIQFMRYVQMVSALGADVVLEVHPALRELAACLRPICMIGDGVPFGRFDLHCSLLSLPARFGTALSTIPPPAAFQISPSVQKRWRINLAPKTLRQVGLVWAGNPDNLIDARRSMHFQNLLPLLNVPEVQFFSLQLGEAACQLDDDRVINLIPQLSSFVETAAAILQLDVIVTVDTAVAHLAASLGRPVYLMLPYSACWRWMVERDDSPWYPTMRLFRQPSPADWKSVVGAVASALSDCKSIVIR